MLLSSSRRSALLHRVRSNQGMTLIEVMVSVLVLTLCTWMLSTTLMASAHHADSKRERALAVNSATNLLEYLHALPFDQVFALYNESPEDDPLGPGTAPGSHFPVEGLEPLLKDADGFVGRLLLPSPGPSLREDTDNKRLGLPRDLNGDLNVDEEDHGGDYLILPLVIEVEWQGSAGRRIFNLETILSGIGRHDQ